MKNNFDYLLILVMLVFVICLAIGSLFLNNDDNNEIALSTDGSTLIVDRSPYDLKNFTVIDHDNTHNIMWICNNSTKVVYVATYETYRSAKPHFINITPLLNADGTPVIYES